MVLENKENKGATSKIWFQFDLANLRYNATPYTKDVQAFNGVTAGDELGRHFVRDLLDKSSRAFQWGTGSSAQICAILHAMMP